MPNTIKLKIHLFFLAFLLSFSAYGYGPTVFPKFYATTNIGGVCSACKLYTYAAGTTTPLVTYSNAAGSANNTNPVILDSTGKADVYPGNSSYKFVLKDSNSVTLWMVDNINRYTTYAEFLTLTSSMSSTSFPASINYIKSGSTYTNTLQTYLDTNTVNVKDFGAQCIGSGHDDTAQINAAIAYVQSTSVGTGTILLPRNGLCYITSPITLTTSGMRISGDGSMGSYLLTPNGTLFDMVRMANSRQEVDHILFRPGTGGGNLNIRVYAAFAQIHDNTFLSGTNGSGTAIGLDDTIPGGAFVPGAYTHNIYNNSANGSGFSYARFIDDLSTQGMTSLNVYGNFIIADNPIRIVKGGGNKFYGNLLQSRTGVIGTPVGNGIDLGDDIGETVWGNYFELFSNEVIARATSDTYRQVTMLGNHSDNNTTDLNEVSKTNNHNEDDSSNYTRYPFGWEILYQNANNFYFKIPNGSTAINVDNTGGVTISKLINTPTSLSYTADSQTQTPTSSLVYITGAGAPRATCVLGISGISDGQRLTIEADTWPVTLTSSNIRFTGGAASANFGNTAGYAQGMELIYKSSLGKWWEISRSVY